MNKTAKQSGNDRTRAKTGGTCTKRRPANPSTPETVNGDREPDRSRHAKRVYRELLKLYPGAHCALTHCNAYELLISTILSAQCTDVRVNKVTPSLFEKYPNPMAMAQAPLHDIEEAVRTTGFYRNKAKHIQATCRILVDQHQGRVPDTMQELVRLAGVARKTANVVLGNAFGKNEGVVVDTHVGRLSRRLGFTQHTDPKKIEQELIALFPRKNWAMLAHLLIFHGRAVCKARKPLCETCSLAKICPKMTLLTKKKSIHLSL